MQHSRQTWARVGLVGALAAIVILAACRDTASAPTALQSEPGGRINRTVFAHPGMISSSIHGKTYTTCGIPFLPPSGYEDVLSWNLHWTINGNPMSSGEQRWNYTNAGSSYTIGLLATDAYGDSLTDAFGVSIASSHTNCLIVYEEDDQQSPTFP